jgi:hypothetical protein
VGWILPLLLTTATVAIDLSSLTTQHKLKPNFGIRNQYYKMLFSTRPSPWPRFSPYLTYH